MRKSASASKGRDSKRGEPSVLVIDDLQDIREMFATVLSGAGYNVVDAESGPAALRGGQESEV